MNMYQEELMDHYYHPRNKGRLETIDFESAMLNPSCGDHVSYQGCLVDGKVSAIAFSGNGCVISQAAASLLGEAIKGKSIHEIMAIDRDTMVTLVGIALGPVRLRCALLPLEAVHKGINEYLKKSKKV